LENSNFAPIAIFGFRRPESIKNLLISLSQNELTRHSVAYFFLDAPITVADSHAVEQVNKVCLNFSGIFRKQIFIRRESNFGLAKNIETGIDFLLEMYESVIVLEDDLIVSPVFLDFMNSSLRIYQNDTCVMHISGYMFPVYSSLLDETFFLNLGTCWGWGTWRRAWRYYDKNGDLDDYLGINKFLFNFYGVYNFYEQIEANKIKIKKTWAIYWYLAIFKNKGISLHPRKSLVQNMGFDGSGQNCQIDDCFSVEISYQPVINYRNKLKISKKAEFVLLIFFIKLRLKNLIRRLLK
jgi:hypothetical protein